MNCTPFLPIALPLLLQGASVSPWDIARSLIVMMLLPPGFGLLVKARYESLAATLQPHFAQASTLALLVMVVAAVVLQFRTILGLLGTGGILALVVFLLRAFAIGFLLGGKEAPIRSVLGLGTGQRNLSAAILVAGQNFADDPNVLIIVLVAGIVGLILLGGIGGELGKRSPAAA